MPRLAVPTGRIDYLTVGSGEPVTVFAHGLGGSITATRPLASGVAGTRAFFHFRGHGATRVDARGFEYADLAAELTAVADHLAATRALGVSLGAGALLRLVAGSPARFDRLVFFLPAAIDRPCVGAASDRIAELTAALTSGSLEQVEGLVRDEIPAPAHDRVEVPAYVAARARALLRVRDGLPALGAAAPIADRGLLASVTAPALVIGCEGDPLHDAVAARELAAALPKAQLHVFTEPGVVWTHRPELRELIAGFLDGR